MRFVFLLLVIVLTIYGCGYKDASYETASIDTANISRMTSLSEYFSYKKASSKFAYDAVKGNDMATGMLIALSDRDVSEVVAELAPRDPRRFTTPNDVAKAFVEDGLPSILKTVFGIFAVDRVADFGEKGLDAAGDRINTDGHYINDSEVGDIVGGDKYREDVVFAPEDQELQEGE